MRELQCDRLALVYRHYENSTFYRTMTYSTLQLNGSRDLPSNLHQTGNPDSFRIRSAESCGGLPAGGRG